MTRLFFLFAIEIIEALKHYNIEALNLAFRPNLAEKNEIAKK